MRNKVRLLGPGGTIRARGAVKSAPIVSLNDLCDAGTVTVHRIVFEGPAAIAVRIATELADADGVELISSEPLSVVGSDTVKLGVAVEGALESVNDAIAQIRDRMPSGASIEIANG